jgi:hypothetical protein
MVNNSNLTVNAECLYVHENKENEDFYYGQAGSVNNVL